MHVKESPYMPPLVERLQTTRYQRNFLAHLQVQISFIPLVRMMTSSLGRPEALSVTAKQYRYLFVRRAAEKGTCELELLPPR